MPPIRGNGGRRVIRRWKRAMPSMETGRRIVRLVSEMNRQGSSRGPHSRPAGSARFQDGLDLAAGQRVVHLLEVRQDERALYQLKNRRMASWQSLVGIQDTRSCARPTTSCRRPNSRRCRCPLRSGSTCRGRGRVPSSRPPPFVGIADAGDLQPLVGRVGGGTLPGRWRRSAR